MEQHENRHEYNEIVIFLINLFVIEVMGRFALTMAVFVCRQMGWESVVNAYHAIPMYGFWTFIVLMVVAMGISVIRIIRN